ncbi:ABC transporter permease [Bosea minatitlanensis]|jgi:NitT/TauT family transport system permease protein|uniref:ABC transporter permease n=1 Tax=Bosea minatitlanensis TaxID=128782 RepID=A0ABW0F3H4_9HYPH|nr:ABC transporter permease subunit [Bosea minatitlanensis]MCT4493997.1 ABC transporter permease subunit [Bosea minatitlanensis]
MTRGGSIGSIGLLVVVAAGLEALSRSGRVSAFVMPPPSEILAAIPALVLHEGLGYATWLTFQTTFAATAAALLLGVPAGAVLARRRLLGQAYEPWLEAAFAAPIILLYPLFLIFFGRSLVTVAVMGFVVAVIPVIIKTREGITAVRPVLHNLALSLHMTPLQSLAKIVLPAALPTIFVGLRLGLIYAMINIVAVEFLVGIGGLGFVVADMYDRYDIPSMYSAVVFVIVLSSLFFLLIERGERWLRPV